MRTITTDRLRGTASEHDVVQLVRDYVGEWLPEELGRLPVECRPGKVRDAEDINELAFKLTSACVSFDVAPDNLRAMEEMDAFLGQACRRMAEITGRGATGETSKLASSPY